jgi:hypothetical protein
LNELLSFSPRPVVDQLHFACLINRVRYEQFASGTPASSTDLESLLACHRRGRSFGRHDDHMEVLWGALVSRDRHEEASLFLFDYLTKFRRERRPCSHFLRIRSASDPMWARVHFLPEGGYAES